MKRSLIFILFTMVTTVAGAGWHIHESDGCALQTRVLAKDYYYFCGAHEAKCHGDWAEDVELQNGFVTWDENGRKESLNGQDYWCCGGHVTSKPTKRKGSASGTPGRWVKAQEGEDFSVTEVKEKVVGGGTCQYIETRDVCGNITSTESQCAEQARQNVVCSSGQYYRTSTKSCTTPCGTGQAYESADSNRCVECAETTTQGVIDVTAPAEDQICRKCNAASELFNPVTRKCVLKSSVTQLSATELLYGKNSRTKSSGKVSEQCWTKFNNEYKDCVLK